MAATDWLRETARRFQRDSPRTAVRESCRELYLGGLRRLNTVWQLAPTIYDREWEVLVVLDGCRTDLLAEVADEYKFLTSPGWATSPASQSREWMRQSFAPQYREEMAKTVYVSANPYTEKVLDPNDFLRLDEVWKYAWDDEAGTVPPRPVTDRAIDAGRELDAERLIVHYMQPHFPSLADSDIASPFRRQDPGWVPGHAWDQLRDGEITYGRLWEAYRDNLRIVLDDVKLLLSNLESDQVVITADHGNATGEWGVYGHPPQMPNPSLHVVPWYETTATDKRTREPDPVERDTSQTDEKRLTEKLRRVGYLGE